MLRYSNYAYFKHVWVFYGCCLVSKCLIWHCFLPWSSSPHLSALVHHLIIKDSAKQCYIYIYRLFCQCKFCTTSMISYLIFVPLHTGYEVICKSNMGCIPRSALNGLCAESWTVSRGQCIKWVVSWKLDCISRPALSWWWTEGLFTYFDEDFW